MDIDKIVSDLVEKRLKDHLAETISEQFDNYGQHRLRDFVEEQFSKSLESMRGEITQQIQVAINKVFLQSEVFPKIEVSASFNMPTHELLRELQRRKDGEKQCE